ncbi:MAG: tripartite tricarboxylate transporter substrate binding protein [Burkholderiales bacterium]
MRNTVSYSAALLVTLAAAPDVASAQTGADAWPVKPIRLIIPFPPGGSSDIIARQMGVQLSERLGKPVVIDNRGGAGGTLGTEMAARAVPDGHTLLMISSSYPVNAALYKLPYDPIKSFAPVAMLGTGPTVLAVYPGVPAQTTKELIALAKAKPGQLKYTSSGVGGLQHFCSALFLSMAKIEAVHIPYKGGSQGMMDVIGGHAEMSIGSLIQMLPHIKSGKLRALGTGGLKRSVAMPEVPAIAETVPGYDANNTWGILTPAGTPPAVLRRLNAEILAVLASPDLKKRLSAEGAEPATVTTPEEFGRVIRDEIAKWTRVARDANIKPE